MGQKDRLADGRLTRDRGQREATIDQLDAKILTRLEDDGRIPFRQMAQEFHASTSTISARVSRLEEAGVITGYSVNVNFDALGYDLTAIVDVLVSKGKLPETEAEIANLPGVCMVYDVTGESDCIVIAKFKKREELGRFTKLLLAMPFVERSNTHVALSIVKESLRIPLQNSPLRD
jgi:DNA-binding Lrp family transcriptional regulator